MKIRHAIAFFALTAVAMGGALGAAEVIYTGATKGSWFVDSNWSSGAKPTADDDVTIPAGKIVKATTGAIQCSSLTITGSGAELDLGTGDLAPQTIAAIGGDLTVTAGGVLKVYAGALTDVSVFADAFTDITAAARAIYQNPTVVSIGGTFTVSGGGIVYPYNEMVTGAAVFFKPVNFTLAADGLVDTRNRGWYSAATTASAEVPAGAVRVDYQTKYSYSFCFGLGKSYNSGAGYGGKAYYQQTLSGTHKSGRAYGYEYAPYLSGSMSGFYVNRCRGSGSIVVLATGTVTLNGTLNADGTCYSANDPDAATNPGEPTTSKSNFAVPSGGGIWVCGKNLTIDAAATLTAKGADVNNAHTSYYGCGGGGRIAVGTGLKAEDWDALSQATTLPEGYMASTLAGCNCSVAGGAMNFGQSANKSDDGTMIYVASTKGKTTLTVASDQDVTAEGITYGDFIVNTDEELTYSAGDYGYLTTNPDNVRYARHGWTLTDKDGAVAASGLTSPAQFTLDSSKGPYTLTWNWTDCAGRRCVEANGPGTFTVNGGAATSSAALWDANPDSGTDTLVAIPDEGATFVGWFGIPSGKATTATVTVPRSLGERAVAVFAPTAPSYADKTWIGGTIGKWSDAASWNPSGVPTLESDVKVTSGTCFAAQGAVAHSITVSSGANFQLAAKYAALSTDPNVPDSTDRAKSRFLYLSGNFSCAGKTLIAAEGAIYTNLHLEVAGDFALTGSGTADVTAMPCLTNERMTTNALYAAATPFKIGGALSVGGTSILYSRCDGFTGAAVRFEPSTLSVAEGATISSYALGWIWRAYAGDPDPRATKSGSASGVSGYETCSFGPGCSFSQGAGHGGGGNLRNVELAGAASNAYGHAIAPFLPGSPNGNYDSYPGKRAGGVVWIKCVGEANIQGTIDVRAPSDIYGSPSGGSIWLLATGLSVGQNALLTAEGGGSDKNHYYHSTGGGGRICIALGLNDADIAAVATGMLPVGVTSSEEITLVTTCVLGGQEAKAGYTDERAESGTVRTLTGSHANQTVNITGTPLLSGTPTPAYGGQSYPAGRKVTFTATADGYGYGPGDFENVRYTYVGFEVTDMDGNILTNGTERSFDYVIPDEETTLTWLWKDREEAIHVPNPQGATFGSVRINGVLMEDGGRGWGQAGETATVEAVPADGYEFLYWMGEYPYGQATNVSLTLSTAETRWLRPIFRLAEAPTMRTWRGSSTIGIDSVGQWLDPDSWQPANLPGLHDDVVIANAGVNGVFVTNNYLQVKSIALSNAKHLWQCTRSDYGTHNYDLGGFFMPTISDKVEEIALVADNIVVSNESQLVVGYQNDLGGVSGYVSPSARERVIVADSLILTNSAKMLVCGGEATGEKDFAAGTGLIRVGGRLALEGTSTLDLWSHRHSGGSVVVRAKEVFVAEGAHVSADCGGYSYDKTQTVSPDTVGQGSGFQYGAGHGGRGIFEGAAYDMGTHGIAYGNEFAPIRPGACNGNYKTGSTGFNVPGGGVVRIHAQTMTVDGRVTADAPSYGESGWQRFGGAAGGSVWLTADSFSFGANALLSAKGGDSDYSSEGGGGRIAICERLTARQIAAFAAGATEECGVGRRRLASFLAAHPALTSESVRIRGGLGCVTGATDPDYVQHPELTVGTFRYLKPVGFMFILR